MFFGRFYCRITSFLFKLNKTSSIMICHLFPLHCTTKVPEYTPDVFYLSDLILGLPCLVWTLADLFKIPIQRPHTTILNRWWIQCFPTKNAAELCPNLLVESFGLEIPATQNSQQPGNERFEPRPAWKVHGLTY